MQNSQMKLQCFVWLQRFSEVFLMRYLILFTVFQPSIRIFIPQKNPLFTHNLQLIIPTTSDHYKGLWETHCASISIKLNLSSWSIPPPPILCSSLHTAPQQPAVINERYRWRLISRVYEANGVTEGSDPSSVCQPIRALKSHSHAWTTARAHAVRFGN